MVGILFSVKKENMKPETIAGKTKNKASDAFMTIHIARVAIAYNMKYLFLQSNVTKAEEKDKRKTNTNKKNGTKVDRTTKITFIATINPNSAMFSTNFSFFENTFINKF